MNPEKINSIKAHHIPSLKGLWAVVKHRKFYKKGSFILSLSISFLFTMMNVGLENKDLLLNITNINQLIGQIFPSLLGFSLGGYAMVVNFPNNDLIQTDSSADDYSLYQILNAFFGVSILLQILVVAISFMTLWLLNTKASPMLTIQMRECSATAANLLFIFFTTFTAVYSLAILPFVVLNLFSLSQVNSSYFTIRKEKEKG